MDTLASLRNQVLYFLDEANDTDTTKKNVDYAINLAHKQRCVQHPWSFMLDAPVRFTLVKNQQSYSLHQEFDRPLYFFNVSKHDYLREVPIRNLGPSRLDWTQDQTGREFTLWGRAPVSKQPTAASVLTIVSSSTSDVGSTKSVIVRGETSNGITTETLTPNGTTPVAGQKQFTKILSVTKTSAWVGTMTMTSNSATVTNLTLFPSELGRSYQQFQTLWIPQDTDIIEYRFYRKPSPLVNDNDIPDIPEPHSQILVWDALKFLLGYDGQLDGARGQLIEDNLKRAEFALYSTYFDGGNTMMAATRSVILSEDDY